MNLLRRGRALGASLLLLAVGLAPSASLAAPARTAGATAFAVDSFAGRSASRGWGTASDGNVWRVQAGSTGLLSVSGDEGRVKGNGSMALVRATLGTTTAGDTNVTCGFGTVAFTPAMPGDVGADVSEILYGVDTVVNEGQ